MQEFPHRDNDKSFSRHKVPVEALIASIAVEVDFRFVSPTEGNATVLVGGEEGSGGSDRCGYGV